MVKICDNCNSEIEEDTNFCPNCGLKVSDEDIRTCPTCGFKNNPDAKFCTECGFNLDEGYSETFTTAKRFSNAVQENSTEGYIEKRESIKNKGNDILNDNLTDGLIEKGANGLSKTNRYLGKLKARSIEKSNQF